MTTPDFRTLFESVPGSYVVLEPSAPFPVVAATDGYLRATLTTREAVLGRGLFEVFPGNPDDAVPGVVAALRASLERVVASHTPDTMPVQRRDIRRPAEDGGGFDARWWSAVNAPVLDAEGRLLYIIHRVDDVTEVVRLKQALVDQMPEAVMLLDADGCFAIENRAAAALGVGAVEERDRFGNPVTIELWTPGGERVAPDESPLVRALSHAESCSGVELAVRVADGHKVPVLASAAPIRDGRGALAGATMILQDISPLKEFQRLREEWASLVAHDLQQPINAIVLTSDLMLRSGLDDKTRDRVGRVRTSAKRLSRMVDDLKDASLIESRHLHLEPVRVDLGALLRDVVERVPSADAGEVRLVLPDQPIHARVDAERIDQVLINLLSNARKYGETGTPATVELRVVAGSAEIAVTNRGEGIAADELSVLFKRHGRTRAARQRGVEGSGLGLYIAAGLVEAHGGHIRVDSVPGETTTFRVQLPLDGPAARVDSAPERQTIHA